MWIWVDLMEPQKRVCIDTESYYMAEISDRYPLGQGYYVRLSHKYIAGVSIEIGIFVSEWLAHSWIQKNLIQEEIESA